MDRDHRACRSAWWSPAAARSGADAARRARARSSSAPWSRVSGLLVYDWAWGALVRLSRLLTDALLGLPWVADGVERMFETLLIGGAAGTAVAAEFVIPLLVLFAGGALLALLLMHVGPGVVTSLVYVLGGLALGASVMPFGRRLLAAWLVAVGAVVVLPLLWSVVFVTGAALMLDAEPAGGSADSRGLWRSCSTSRRRWRCS